MNYFELFEIPVSLHVDPSSIQKKFYELSRRYHPDYYAQSGEEEQSEALENSSMVNKAYKTFQNQDATLRYVLELHNLIEEEEKYKLDPEFLMEVMEINEELMDVDEMAGLLRTREKANQLLERIYEEIKPLIENYNDSKASHEDLLKVKDYYFRKKYIYRILDALDKKEGKI
jgi:molecular chaperone HscB